MPSLEEIEVYPKPETEDSKKADGMTPKEHRENKFQESVARIKQYMQALPLKVGGYTAMEIAAGAYANMDFHSRKGVVPQDQRVSFVARVISGFGSENLVMRPHSDTWAWIGARDGVKAVMISTLPTNLSVHKKVSFDEYLSMATPILDRVSGNKDDITNGVVDVYHPCHLDQMLRDFRDACRKLNYEFLEHGEKIFKNFLFQFYIAGKWRVFSRDRLVREAGDPAKMEFIFRYAMEPPPRGNGWRPTDWVEEVVLGPPVTRRQPKAS